MVESNRFFGPFLYNYLAVLVLKWILTGIDPSLLRLKMLSSPTQMCKSRFLFLKLIFNVIKCQGRLHLGFCFPKKFSSAAQVDFIENQCEHGCDDAADY